MVACRLVIIDQHCQLVFTFAIVKELETKGYYHSMHSFPSWLLRRLRDFLICKTCLDVTKIIVSDRIFENQLGLYNN